MWKLTRGETKCRLEYSDRVLIQYRFPFLRYRRVSKGLLDHSFVEREDQVVPPSSLRLEILTTCLVWGTIHLD